MAPVKAWASAKKFHEEYSSPLKRANCSLEGLDVVGFQRTGGSYKCPDDFLQTLLGRQSAGLVKGLGGWGFRVWSSLSPKP